MKKLGFFGGTFDPIHFGHLNLAIQIQEAHQLDEVFFCPTSLSPHKLQEQPAVSKEHRLAMTHLAIAPIKSFTLIDWELDQEGPSYTIDTIHELKKKYPDDQIHLILGEDSLKGLSSWKEAETLLKLAPPLIGTRSIGKKWNLSAFSREVKEKILQGCTPIAVMDISSTVIRSRLLEEKYCGHLIPFKVLDYIYQNELY